MIKQVSIQMAKRFFVFFLSIFQKLQNKIHYNVFFQSLLLWLYDKVGTSNHMFSLDAIKSLQMKRTVLDRVI